MLARSPQHRVVQGLRWARPCVRPACIPRGRARGVKALGLAFERRVWQAVESRVRGVTGVRDVARWARPGQWFEFEDANGHGWCQVDVVFRHDDRMVVLECKLTDVAQGQSQLCELYLPVVALASRRPAVGIVVVRHIGRDLRLGRVCTSLREALAVAQGAGSPSVLHWLGKGAI